MANSPPDGRSVLLQASALDTSAETGVYELLGRLRPAETNLLVLSCHRGPDDWLADWRAHVGTVPESLGFVHVGGTTRSATASSGTEPVGAAPFRFVDAVNDPADLTRLGIRISECLERWAGSDRRTVVYLDTLTTLLQFVELDRAYRFLHVLGGRIRTVDGRAFYKVDPDAHDEQTMGVIRDVTDDAVRAESYAPQA